MLEVSCVLSFLASFVFLIRGFFPNHQPYPHQSAAAKKALL